ncbi:MAG TPA: TlpA family protein disulfide reductase [Xanthomonadaceae bacterium]|nr:TlpA family protein disulfide reductase [Xanthomonadaceae bacterium]
MKPALQWTLIVAFALASAAVGIWLRGAFDEARVPPPPPGLKVVALGESAEPLLGTTLDGVNQPLPGEGRWRLINFWASWCPPCVKEMPLLDAYHHAQGADGVQVIGIALEDAADAAAFLDRVPVDFPIFAEPNSRTDSSVRLGNTRGVLPYTVLIDPQGRLVAQHLRPFPDVEAIEAWVGERKTSAAKE